MVFDIAESKLAKHSLLALIPMVLFADSFNSSCLHTISKYNFLFFSSIRA